MGVTLEGMVDIAEELVKFSASAMEINRLANDDSTDLPALASAVETDPNFSVNLLRIANSPVYLRGESTASIAQAITRVGRRELGQMAFASACMEGMAVLEGELLQIKGLWRDGMLIGGIARELCVVAPAAREYSFAAGMLHSIGTMVLNSQAQGQMEQVLNLSLDFDLPLYTAEEQVLGFNNAALGGAMARRWNFPEPLSVAIEYQYAPEKAPSHKETVAVMAIASAVLEQALQYSEFEQDHSELEQMLDRLNIREKFEAANLDADLLFEKAREGAPIAA